MHYVSSDRSPLQLRARLLVTAVCHLTDIVYTLMEILLAMYDQML